MGQGEAPAADAHRRHRSEGCRGPLVAHLLRRRCLRSSPTRVDQAHRPDGRQARRWRRRWSRSTRRSRAAARSPIRSRKPRSFPPMVGHMVSVGEESGQLEAMLTKVADFYEAEVDTKVKALTSLIEPAMIVDRRRHGRLHRDRDVPAALQPLRQDPVSGAQAAHLRSGGRKPVATSRGGRLAPRSDGEAVGRPPPATRQAAGRKYEPISLSTIEGLAKGARPGVDEGRVKETPGPSVRKANPSRGGDAKPSGLREKSREPAGLPPGSRDFDGHGALARRYGQGESNDSEAP